jgi:adenine-specific DNA-methyltransferase
MVHLFLATAPPFQGVSKIVHTDKNRINTLFELSNYETTLNYLNNLKPIQGYFYREFSPEGHPKNTDKPRLYFTARNAAKIDAIRVQIKLWKKENLITEYEHSLLLHDLIMAANDIANIAGTYGHYLSKLIKRAEDPIQLYCSSFSGVGTLTGHRVYRGYAEDIAPKLTADYAANYHILETLAREDEPEAIGESGLRPWRDQYSNFCSKVKIRGSFDKILTQVKCSDFLISYSEDGLIPIDELINFLSTYGKVKKKDIKYKRFKSNNSLKNTSLNEYLIHLKMS